MLDLGLLHVQIFGALLWFLDFESLLCFYPLVITLPEVYNIWDLPDGWVCCKGSTPFADCCCDVAVPVESSVDACAPLSATRAPRYCKCSGIITAPGVCEGLFLSQPWERLLSLKIS
jgi:hypothetical protein